MDSTCRPFSSEHPGLVWCTITGLRPRQRSRGLRLRGAGGAGLDGDHGRAGRGADEGWRRARRRRGGKGRLHCDPRGARRAIAYRPWPPRHGLARGERERGARERRAERARHVAKSRGDGETGTRTSSRTSSSKRAIARSSSRWATMRNGLHVPTRSGSARSRPIRRFARTPDASPIAQRSDRGDERSAIAANSRRRTGSRYSIAAGVPCGVVRTGARIAARYRVLRRHRQSRRACRERCGCPPPKLDEHGAEIRARGWAAFDSER